jgi:CBS domain containing-hemolysin-like protein
MPRRKTSESQEKRSRPATTPEGEESRMINRAMRLAERQIEEGTASAQVITHFLKLGTSRERLEQERLSRENELLKARAEAMASAKEVAVLYEDALKAMRTYSGQDPFEYSDVEG